MRIEEANEDTTNDSDIIINLKNINMPFLNIVARRDDLVAPRSSKTLNNALTESHDKDLIEFNSGHVGLMIGKNAHKELWPKVGDWLRYGHRGYRQLLNACRRCILLQQFSSF
jgi:poly(3-hydroxyalkanoate) synthetase